MSFRNKGRKFRPISGKTFPSASGNVAASDSYKFAAVIAEALHDAFGGTRMSVKTVIAYTGAGERAVKNWFEGKNGPNGENLVRLVHHSDEVLEAFLLMAGREDILAAKLLVDARDKLVEILAMIEQLQAGIPAGDPNND